MKYYTFENKPEFNRNDEIFFNVTPNHLRPVIFTGKIVCKGATHIIDKWFVRCVFCNHISKVIDIGHTCIVDLKSS
jgi:hypothetical protein